MGEQEGPRGLTSGAGTEALAPKEDSGFGPSLLILGHCCMTLGSRCPFGACEGANTGHFCPLVDATGGGGREASLWEAL